MRIKEFVTEADFVNKPAGKIADEIAKKLGQDDARPGGRRIGPYPKGQAFPHGDAGASPGELGKHKRIAKQTPGMDKVNQALKNVDVNKLTPDKKASLIKRLNRVLKLAGKAKLPGMAKILPVIAMLGSAGLEWLDPSLKEAIDNLKEDLVGQPVGILHKKIINEQEILNEKQYKVLSVGGSTIELQDTEPLDPMAPEPEFAVMNVPMAGKEVVLGQQGWIIRDQQSTPEDLARLRKEQARGDVYVDLQTANVR